MGTTGVIFAAIAIAWLAYLVPHFVRRREGEAVDEADPVDHFSDSVRVVRRGAAPLLDQDLAELREHEVSTPVTRRAAVADLRRLETVAAARRRRVLSALLALVCAAVSVSSVGWLPWASVAVPGLLVVAFVVVSRVSVRVMRRDLDERYRTICRGGDEDTVRIRRKDVGPAREPGKGASPAPEKSEHSGWWDPVPITVPTYVSKPLAPRTVRTIDLSGPGVTSSARASVPVTADAPPAAEESVVEDGRRDAGGAQAASA